MSKIVLSVLVIGALDLSAAAATAGSLGGGPIATPPIVVAGPVHGPVGWRPPIHVYPIGPTPAPGPINPGGPNKPAPGLPTGPVVSPFSW
jgi:hypothetical protein